MDRDTMLEIKDIFERCDTDKSGYIERGKLQKLLPNMNGEQIDKLMSLLDQEGDGRISFTELANSTQTLKLPTAGNRSGDSHTKRGDNPQPR